MKPQLPTNTENVEVSVFFTREVTNVRGPGKNTSHTGREYTHKPVACRSVRASLGSSE